MEKKITKKYTVSLEKADVKVWIIGAITRKVTTAERKEKKWDARNPFISEVKHLSIIKMNVRKAMFKPTKKGNIFPSWLMTINW